MVQLKAFARQDGFFVGLVWCASFAALAFMPQSILSLFLGFVSLWLAGRFLCRFRDSVLGGSISFLRAWLYSTFVFVYASLIFSVGLYVYFRFIDGGRFVALMRQSMNPEVLQQYGLEMPLYTETINAMAMLTPIQWSMMFLLQNITAGFFLGLLLALIYRKSK